MFRMRSFGQATGFAKYGARYGGAVALVAGAVTFGSLGLITTPAGAQGPEFSANVGLTTDYIFRGYSQTDEGPAIQGGMDVTWNIFYAGVWGSNLDFGSDGNGGDVADI